MTPRIPPAWMPECPPGSVRRLILHWTAGGYKAGSLDKKHYHYLIEGSGNHVRAVDVRRNCPLDKDRYAAHTLNANGGAIAVAVCCMFGARQSPFHGGKFPMKRSQWNALIIAAADLCRRYDIPVTRETVLGHGEVQRNLGISQNGKWEFVLPWEPTLTVPLVGDMLRRRVALAIEQGV